MTIIQQKRKALGSNIIITIEFSGANQSQKKIFQMIWKEIDEFENKFSRFLPNSELSIINKKAGQINKISSDFNELIQKSIKMATKSNNLFNPFVLPALQKSGYIGSWPNVSLENNDLNFSNRKICSIKDLKVSKNYIQIPKTCAIDFGGIGKGYLLEKVTAKILANRIKNFWLSFGGDIICFGSKKNEIGWQIGVASAKDNKLQIDSIETNGKKIAIATSGIIKRKGLENRKPWHHIINPLTGSPAKNDILTATVVAKNAILADVYAKVMVILGLKKAKKFVKDKKIIMAILQTKNNSPIKILGK